MVDPSAVTLTVTGVTSVALMTTVGGTWHVVPLGAPLQLNAATPLIPAPPMDSGYVALVPLVIVEELEPGVATRKPKP